MSTRPDRLPHLLLLVICLALAARAAPAQGLTPQQRLGRSIFFDRNLSSPRGQACASCHDPGAGFTAPDSEINAGGAVMPGAVSNRFGPRKPPSMAYAAFSPDRLPGGLIGGQAWDGRAANLVAQAQAAFLGPLEMNNGQPGVVVKRVREAAYAPLFERVYGRGSLRSSDVGRTFDRIAQAIAAYAASSAVIPFSSKYDAFLAGRADLTDSELRGLALFEGPANCATCHPNRPAADGTPPLFTDFRFSNLGVPANPANPFYDMPRRFNPDGAEFIDLGLGFEHPARAGLMKTPTLRNVDRRPEAEFVRAYMHNGVFKSLEEVVHFYNARNLPGEFPPPEVDDPDTINFDDLGSLGLTAAEEADLVAFLKTLTDGWEPAPGGP